MKRLLRIGILLAVALVTIAAPVLANDAFYSFTMDYRYVNGKNNGVFHTLTAGALHNSGQVWAYTTDPGHNSNTNDVTIEVWQHTPTDHEICYVKMHVPNQINSGVQFDKDCGNVVAGTYYIIAWKVEDDGWSMKGQGDLVTH